MAKLTGNWYTDPMGEFYDWKTYYQLYDEQEQSNSNETNKKDIQEKTIEECEKCRYLEVLTDVDDEYVYRCSMMKEYRTNTLQNLIKQVHIHNKIRVR